MKRRTFIKLTSLSLAAVSVPGFISFNGERFVGDCETTTDILGPFYRPGAPVRSVLSLPGDGGIPVKLSGTVFHDDCATPLAKAAIDIWHCGPDGLYDNTTQEFRYRGKFITGVNGFYEFTTIIPVPYDTGDRIRPAHFHLLISAEGYQDLVTQLYFTGDPFIEKDPFSSSPQAKKRILEVIESKDGSEFHFDITMKEHFPAEDAVLDKLSGKYYNIEKPEQRGEFYRSGNQLWLKFYDDHWKMETNTDLYYIGKNKFKSYGRNEYYEFVLLAGGGIKLILSQTDDNGKEMVLFEALKEK